MCVGIVCCFPRSIWSQPSLAVWRRSVAICGYARGISPALRRCVAFLRAWRCLLVLMAQAKVHVTAWTIWSWHQWQWPFAKAFGQLLRRYSKVSRSYQDLKVTWTWQGIINCLHQHVICWIMESQDCQHILHSKPWQFPSSRIMMKKHWNGKLPCVLLPVVQFVMLTWQNGKNRHYVLLNLLHVCVPVICSGFLHSMLVWF